MVWYWLIMRCQTTFMAQTLSGGESKFYNGDKTNNYWYFQKLSFDVEILLLLFLFYLSQNWKLMMSVVDLREAQGTSVLPPGSRIFFNFMQFLENVNKIVSWRPPPPPLRVDAPSSGKSWIRHWWYSPRGNWPFEGELADFIHNNVMQTNVKFSCKVGNFPFIIPVFGLGQYDQCKYTSHLPQIL